METANDCILKTGIVNEQQRIIKCSIMNALLGLCHVFNKSPQDDLRVDVIKLNEIAQRCERDFERIKNHHPNIQEPDEYKISAYCTYWICKIHPLKILTTTLDPDLARFANPFLALITSFGIINERKALLDPSLEKIHLINNINRTMLHDFLYTLMYCDLNADLISIIYGYMDAMVPYINKK